MKSIPAICDNCNCIFPVPCDINCGNVSLILTNCAVGPCPICGAMGHIPNGTYRLINDVVHILNAPQKTIHELIALSDILQKVKDDKISLENATSEIKENVSNLSNITELLPKSREEKRSDIKFLITTIIAIISIILTFKLSNTETQNNYNINTEQIINTIYQMQETNNSEQKLISKKIGRNDLCPCGSGLKYKYCHGK